MTSTTVDERSGVARLRAKERRRWMIVAGCFVLIAADLLLMWAGGILPRDLSDIPPDMALGIACGMVVGAGVGWRFLCRQTDEHDIRARQFGSQIGFTAFLLALPFWACLAQGGVAPPVNVVAVYIGSVILYLAAFLWRKYR